jgi:hypothetical protein
MVDFTFVHTAAQAVGGWEPYGFPVKPCLELIVTGMVALAFLRRGWQITRASVKWIKGTPSVTEGTVELSEAMPPDDPTFGWSDAMQVAYACLQKGRPVYDPDKHELHCPGLMVEFTSDLKDPGVLKLIGNPEANPKYGTKGEVRWLGRNLAPLISPEELSALADGARAVRETVIERDRNEANFQAAQEMVKAAYKHRPKVYEPAEQTDDFEVMTGGRPAPDPAYDPENVKYFGQPTPPRQLRGGTNAPKPLLKINRPKGA